jgi:prepilin-type N-terminal cleavage/methylation domain-containing protein
VSRQRGFTLLEVMIGLALMGLALVVLMKSAAGSIFNSEQAHMTGVVTDLARGKMYDIEEILLKDGFTDTSQSNESEECFTDEGWPNVCYTYKVEEPKLPTFEELTQMAQGKATEDAKKALGSAGSAGSALLGQLGSGDLGSDGIGGAFGDSMLGGMLGMFGASSGIDAAAGASMIQSQYAMFQEVLKVSVRKVTLSVTWTVIGSKRDMKVVAFFTDPTAMNKTLLGQASGALEASGGSGGGSTPSSTTPSTRPPSRGGGGGGK